MTSGCRTPAACFLATWHALSRRQGRPLPSWMMLAVRLVRHIQASQLPPNTPPSVCIHDGTLPAERESRKRSTNILCIIKRDACIYTQRSAGKYTVCAVYAETRSSVVSIHPAFDSKFMSISNLQRVKGWTNIQTYSRCTACDTLKEKKSEPMLSILLRWPFGLVNLSPGNRNSLSTTATPLRTCS